MNITRVITRVIFVLAFIISICVILIVTLFKCFIPVDSLNVIAASLAVITAILSSYGSLKLLENEEDSRRPKVIIEPDLFSMAWHVQISIKNIGFELAENIQIIFDKEYQSTRTQQKVNDRDIVSIMPSENIRISIASSVYFLKNDKKVYKGQLIYCDSKQKKYKDRFCIDFGKYEKSTIYTNDYHEAAEKLTKFPEKMDKLIQELHLLNTNFKKYVDKEYINRLTTAST